MKKRRNINWQRCCYRGIISMICAMMILTLIPANLIEVKAATTGLRNVTIDGETFVTDEHGLMAYRKMPNTEATYDIYGKYDGKWIQTTYQDYYTENRGYVPKSTGTGVKIEATPVFINEGRYIQMNYRLKANTEQTVSFSIAADIMIGSDDFAPITAFSDKSGFKMVNRNGNEKGAQFNFYGKNVYGTAPGISTYWFGYYSNRDSYRYTQVSSSSLSGTDSAMSCSWKNLKVNSAGVDVSMIIGTGEANVAPEIGEITIPDNIGPTTPGSNIQVTVPVSNATGDNSASKIKLYYSLVKLDGTIIDGPNQITDVTTDVQGSITKFIAKFQIPNSMPSGPFILKVFAMNDKGGISAEVQKQLQATAKPITITSTSGNQTTTYQNSVPINVTVSSSATSANPLVYQWQELNSSNVYQDITGATKDTYNAPATSVGTKSYRCKIRYQNDTASSVYSTAMQVVVNKLASKTVFTSNFDNTNDTLNLKATVSANGSAINGTVYFYNGSNQIGTAATSNGVATLTLDASKLESGTQNMTAAFTGNANAYASTSDAQKVTINLKMKILYDQFISEQDGGVIRSYREGLETILKDPLILRDGYDFVGWMNSAGTIMDRITSTIRGNQTLTSQWKLNTYRITIDDNLGSASRTQNEKVGSTVQITAPENENYEFSKWVCSDASLITGKENNANLSFVMPSKEISLVAQYKEKSFSITYQDSSVQANWPTTYTYGSTQTLPEASKDGFIFMGWHKNSAQGELISQITSNTSGNITLYPAWSKLNKVSIQTSLGGQAQTPLEAEYASGDEIIIPASSYEGYEFKNWEVVSGDLTIEQPDSATLMFTMPSSDVVVKANYQPIQYTITYELNGGVNDSSNPATYDFGSTMSFAPAQKEGYRFDGWFTDQACTNRKTSMVGTETGSITLYAKYSVDSYLLTLTDAVMKNESATSSKVGFGTKVILTPAVKNGYSFTKWTTQPSTLSITPEADGTYSFTMPASEVKIKAEYEKTSYIITYHVDESVDISNKAWYPDKYVLGYSKTLANPTKLGYTFDGWYKDSRLTQKITEITASDTGNLDLYPKWNVNSYRATVSGGKFDDNTTSKAAIAYQSEVKTTPTVPTGMKLDRWLLNNQIITNFPESGVFTFKMGAQDTLVQAEYVASAYTITYDLNVTEAVAGAVLENPNEGKTSYTFGESYPLAYPTSMTSDGDEANSFDGWVIKGTDTKLASITPTTTGNLELVAKWAVKSYKISYEGIDGAVNENELNGSKYDVASQAQDITLNEPKKVGYNFKGWELKNTNASASIVDGTTLHLQQSHTGDITLNATWEAAEISYFVDENELSSYIGAKIDIGASDIKGYVFDHWEIEGDAILKDVTSKVTSFQLDAALIESIQTKGDLKFSSIYRPATYKLTYTNLEDAINNNPASHTYGEKVELASPVRSGYEFKGWKDVADGIILGSDIGDKTLEATWEAINYDVVVNNGTTQQSTAKINDTVTINAEERAGYSFAGWSVDNGDITLTNDAQASFTMPAGDVEITAQYALNTYTISYFDGATLISSDNPATYTIEDEDIVLKPANKDGYDFNGWYDALDQNGNGTGNKIETIATDSIKDQTLYASYTKKKHTIKVTTTGLGSYEFRVDGQISSLTDGEYVTDATGKNVRIQFKAENGYQISSITINGVAYEEGDTLRFDNFTGVYDIKVNFAGSPVITPPSGDQVEWVDGDDLESEVGTITKDDVSITLTPITGTTTMFQIIKVGDKLQETAWKTYENTIVLKDEGNYVVYIKVADADGNESIMHSKVIVIDKTAPVLKDQNGQVIGDQKVIYTDQTFQVVEDFLSSIQVNGTIVSRVTLVGNQETTYRIVISDLAGNKTEYVIFAKAILNHDALLPIKDLSLDQVKLEHKEDFAAAIATLNEMMKDAPESQAAYIQSLIKDYEEKLTHIDEIQTLYAKYSKEALELKEEIANEAALKELYDRMSELLGKDNLTQEQRVALTKSQSDVNQKLSLVFIQKDLKDIENVQVDNVKTEDEELLRELEEGLNEELSNNEVLAQNQPLVDALKKEKDRITTLLVKVDEINEAMKKIVELLPKQDFSKPMEDSVKEELRKIQETYASSNNLTEEQKKTVENAKEILDVNDALEDLYQWEKDTITSDSKDRLDEIQTIIKTVTDDNKFITEEKQKELQQVADTAKDLSDVLVKVEQNLNKIEDAMSQDFSKEMDQGKIDDAKTALDELKDSKNTTTKEHDYVTKSDTIIQVIDQINKWKDVNKDTISVEKKAELEELVKQIEAAKDNALLDETKRNELLANVTKVEEMIKQIDKANDAWDTITPDLDQSTGTDYDTLLDQIKRLEDFLANYGNHLDSTKIAQIKQAIADAKEKVANIEKAIKNCDTLLKDSNLQYSDDWNTLADLIERYKNFLDTEGKWIDDDRRIQLEQALEVASMRITTLKNPNLSWILGNDEVTVAPKNGLQLPYKVKMVAEKITEIIPESILSIVKRNLAIQKPDFQLSDVFDIKLLLNQSVYEFDGTMEVRIKLNEAQKKYTELGIIYIDEEGNIKEIASQRDGDYITFEVEHFSQYAIIYKDNGTSGSDDGLQNDTIIKDTGSTHSPLGTSAILLCFMGILFTVRKKRNSF